MRELSPETVAQLQRQLDQFVTTSDSGSPQLDSDVRDALMEAVFLVAASDGKVTALEVSQFADALQSLVGGHADAEAAALRLGQRLGTEGFEARAAAVHEKLKGGGHDELAFRLAVAVAFVDDNVAPAEAAALDQLARALGIEPDRAHTLMSEVRSELFDR